jgi:2-methylaconitate cis-trans-isomerase PrpF
LLRVIGSPDPYGKQIDGMGGATSSTSKTVILSKSSRARSRRGLPLRPGVHRQSLLWTGAATAATSPPPSAPFAISQRPGRSRRIPENGLATVRIWQANIRKTIIAHVPMTDGPSAGDRRFRARRRDLSRRRSANGISRPGAEDGEEGGAMFPTGNLVDELEVPRCRHLPGDPDQCGHPHHFRQRRGHRLPGTELQEAINGDAKALAKISRPSAPTARCAWASSGHQPRPPSASTRPKSPLWRGRPITCRPAASRWRPPIWTCCVRALSMGKLHHAMMGTAAVAIGTAAAVPGTLVNLAAGGGARTAVRFGHPSGTLRVGAEATQVNGQWTVTKAIMSRSARVLMEGWVRVPGDTF